MPQHAAARHQCRAVVAELVEERRLGDTDAAAVDPHAAELGTECLAHLARLRGVRAMARVRVSARVRVGHQQPDPIPNPDPYPDPSPNPNPDPDPDPNPEPEPEP